MQTAVATATQLEFGETDLLEETIDFITSQNSEATYTTGFSQRAIERALVPRSKFRLASNTRPPSATSSFSVQG